MVKFTDHHEAIENLRHDRRQKKMLPERDSITGLMRELRPYGQETDKDNTLIKNLQDKFAERAKNVSVPNNGE